MVSIGERSSVLKTQLNESFKMAALCCVSVCATPFQMRKDTTGLSHCFYFIRAYSFYRVFVAGNDVFDVGTTDL